MTASRRSGSDNDDATKSVGEPEPDDDNGRQLCLHTRAEQRGQAASRANQGRVHVESAARCANEDVGNDARPLASNRHARAMAGAATRRDFCDKDPAHQCRSHREVFSARRCKK